VDRSRECGCGYRVWGTLLMEGRTTQDLLAERRANVLEAMRETDEMAKAMLNAHVAEIDVELGRRRRDDEQTDTEH